MRVLGKGLLAASAVLALASCSPPSEPVAGGPGEAIVGVARAVSGDTIEINGTRIRLNGIDSPRSGTCGDVDIAQEGRRALDYFLAERTVSCEVTGEAYANGSPAAICTVDGENVAAHQVAQGLARDWPRFSGGEYAPQEEAARTAQRGVWSASCPADLWGDRDYSSSEN